MRLDKPDTLVEVVLMDINAVDQFVRNAVIGDLSSQGFTPDLITAELVDAFMPQYIVGLIAGYRATIEAQQALVQNALTERYAAFQQDLIPKYRARIGHLESLARRYGSEP